MIILCLISHSLSSCSGPCMTLVLSKGDTGEGVIQEVRDFLGPKDVEKAKEESPERYSTHYINMNDSICMHANTCK